MAYGALVAPPPGEVAVLAGGGGGGGGPHGGGRGGGGGGGDDDGESTEFLRLLNSVEQASVIEDWAARSRIYKMTDHPEVSELHADNLDECAAHPPSLEYIHLHPPHLDPPPWRVALHSRARHPICVRLAAMHEFDTSGSGPRGRRMVLGLFQEDEIRALAGAEVSHASGLVVSTMLVYPAELNNEDSVLSLRMMHALHLLADAIETPLDMSPLRESGKAAPWLASLVGEPDDE